MVGKIKILIVSLVALTIFISGEFCLAATDNNVISSLGATAVLTKEKDVYVTDLEVRKEILRQILQFSLSEIDNLKTILSKVDAENDQWQKIKDNYLKTLDEFETYYNKIQEKINNGGLTLSEIKNIASDLKDWRENTYSPQLNNIVNMALLFQNEDMLKTAFSRLDKIFNDLKKLSKQNLIKTDSLKVYFDQANRLLNEAKNNTANAKVLFLKIEFPDESQASGKTAEDIEIESVQNRETLRNLIKESLKNLKSAYEIFFQMNSAFKKSF